MRICSLGSGSKGNAAIVAHGTTTLMIDCGFTFPTIRGRMGERGLSLDDVSALLVTHEHADHVRGLDRLRKQAPGIRIHMTRGTARSMGMEAGSYEPICPHEPFDLDGLAITPFPVPHDASEPVQFVIRSGSACLGFLTDSGTVTEHAANMLSDCTVLVVECNYDTEMMRTSKYPERLKRRIQGSHGHLGNGDSCGLLRTLTLGRLRHVVAAHLSENNNLPNLALEAVSACIPDASVEVTVATQSRGFDWIEI